MTKSYEEMQQEIDDFIYLMFIATLVLIIGGGLAKYVFHLGPEKVGNMYLSTDPQTGCQYLSDGHNLTPRLDNTGKQVCK